MSRDVNLKSTKNKILEAYNQSLTEIKRLKQASQAQLNEQSEKHNIVSSALSCSDPNLKTHLNQIKQNLTLSFDELAKNLISENKKLTQVQNALMIQQEKLNENYEIQTQVDSLEALIITNKKMQHEINSEMNKQRETFKNERLKLEQAHKDLKEKLATQRLREEEEYQYNKNITLKKEQQEVRDKLERINREIQEKSERFEKEIAHRENCVIDNEALLKTLQAQVDQFPSKQKEAITKAVAQNSQMLTKQFEYQIKLKESEMQSTISLLEQTKQSLTKTIEEQKFALNTLSEKYSYAQEQVQNIAFKAIENASPSNKFLNFGHKENELEKI